MQISEYWGFTEEREEDVSTERDARVRLARNSRLCGTDSIFSTFVCIWLLGILLASPALDV